MSIGGGVVSRIGDRHRRLLGVAISAALVLAAVALVLSGGGGGGGLPTVQTAPHFVEVSELTDLEGSLGHAIYWAGARPPDRIELKQEVSGSVYLRYLPPGVAAGARLADFLTVGTYPLADAQAVVRRAAAAADATTGQLAGGAVVLANPESRGSVYLAYPDSDLELEVYDPTPGRAMELIRSGAIVPVGEG